MFGVLFYYRQKLFLFRNGFNAKFKHFFPFSSTVNENPSPKNPSFIIHYLINSCGFSKDRALTLSKQVTTIHSPENPDSVLRFLKDCRFSNTQIKTLINRKPELLSAKLEKTIKPKIKFFQDLGMSVPDLAELIVSRPALLHWSLDNHLLPCIDFMRTIFHSDEQIIIFLKRHAGYHYFGDPKVMTCNVSLLRKCGISNTTLSKLILRHPMLLSHRPIWLEESVDRVEKLGVDCSSKVFGEAVWVISKMRESTLDSQFNMFKRFGWSETDILTAFRKVPDTVTVSEIRFRRAMDFFLDVIGYKPSYIAERPLLLRVSLERCIIPRYNVLQALKSKGLRKGKFSLHTMASCSEKRFLMEYVLPYKDKAPEVYEVYLNSKNASLPSAVNRQDQAIRSRVAMKVEELH